MNQRIDQSGPVMKEEGCMYMHRIKIVDLPRPQEAEAEAEAPEVEEVMVAPTEKE
jgi:hypothetical protein